MVWATRRGAYLPLLAFASFILRLPLVNARFEPSVPKARYIAPLLPLCYLAMSLLAVELYQWGVRQSARSVAGSDDVRGVPRLYTLASRTGLVVVIAVLVAGPLVGLLAYYRQEVARGRTNADLYRTITAVNAARRPGDRILVDRALLQVYTHGGGRLYEHLQFAGRVYGWNRLGVDLPTNPDDPLLRSGNVLVVADGHGGLALTTLRLQLTAAGTPQRTPARVFRVLGPSVPEQTSDEVGQ